MRRFELYKFTGTIDPVTGQAICADGVCAAPAANEIGDFIGAQNAAANLNVPVQYPVTVTVSGDGAVCRVTPSSGAPPAPAARRWTRTPRSR
ncbi:MAG: hypothetical protein QOJ99_5902 [Bryobacterales bacterium]|nr:hypothetical protein [Bryobacterales bacterium]